MNERSLQEYWSVIDNAGFLELVDRGKIKVTGPDRVAFLHNMISNDVQRLHDYSGNYATFLRATGKIVADFYYYRFPQWILIDIRQDLLSHFKEGLQKFIIMDDVELSEVVPTPAHFSIQGPASAALMEKLFQTTLPRSSYQLVSSGGEEPAWIIRKGLLSQVGFEVILPRSAREEFRKKLERLEEEGELIEVGKEACEVLRVEAGIPLFGVDMTEENNPLDASLDEAISLDKGCYIGQEVIARATYVGAVARKLARIKIQGGIAPAPGSVVFSPEGKEVGKVTSAVFSPRLETALGLAFLKRSFSEPGTDLQIETSEGRKSAQVVQRFV